MATEITVDELMGLSIDLQKEVAALTKENEELKRQIKLFIDAEQWGKDTAGYEGEYKC